MTNDVWLELAAEISLCDNGGVLYTTAAHRLMDKHGIDGDRLHTAIEDSSGVDQDGEDWIDWDAVARVYAGMENEHDE